MATNLPQSEPQSWSNYWQCPRKECKNASNELSLDMLICPSCSTPQSMIHRHRHPQPSEPEKDDEHPPHEQTSSHPPGMLEVSIEQPNLLAPQCTNPECKHLTLPMSAKFCSNCGRKVSSRPVDPGTANVQAVKRYTPSECYFCTIKPFVSVSSDDLKCLKCKKQQPNHEPQGPPCVHDCGVRLIKPDARVCGRCSKPQTRTVLVQPTIPNFNQTSTVKGHPFSARPSNSATSLTDVNKKVGDESEIHSEQSINSQLQMTDYKQEETSKRKRKRISSVEDLEAEKGKQNKVEMSYGRDVDVNPKPDSITTERIKPDTFINEHLTSEIVVIASKTDTTTSEVLSIVPEISKTPSVVSHSSNILTVEIAASMMSGTAKESTDPISSTTNPQTSPVTNTVVTCISETETTTTAADPLLHVENRTEDTNSDTVSKTVVPTSTTPTQSSSNSKQTEDIKRTKVPSTVATTTALSLTSATTSTYTSTSISSNCVDGTQKSQKELSTTEYRKSPQASVLLQPSNEKKKKEKENNESKSVICMDGLNASSKNSVKLVFHVLIPKVYWEMDGQSTVHIRFGHDKLGDWTDCGKLEDVADQDVIELNGVGIFEMKCTFETFDMDILKNPLAYKYVVHSPKAKKAADCYEYIHGHSHEYNRCLYVELDRSRGEYDKFDTIAYPKSTKISQLSWIRLTQKTAYKLLNAVVGTQQKSKEEANEDKGGSFTPLGHKDMSLFCLSYYLKSSKELLCTGSFSDSVNVETVANDIVFVYSSFLTWCLSSVSDPNMATKALQKSVDQSDLKLGLKLWFESIITSLNENHDMNPTIRLASAVCLVYCITVPQIDLLYKFDEKSLIPLAGMLSLHPDGDVTAEYNHLCSSIIPSHLKSKLASVIANLCKRISGKTVKSLPVEWFMVLPLYHRLIGRVQEFAKPELDYCIDYPHYNIKLGLDGMEEKAHIEAQFVVKYYEHVKGYFPFDPMLIKLFVSMASKKDFQALCERTPPYLAAEVLLYRAKKPVNPDDKIWKRDIERLKSAFAYCLDEYSTCEYLFAMVNSSLQLCSKVAEKLKSSKDNSVELLATAFSCVLFAIEKGDTSKLYDGDHGKTERDKVLKCLENILNKWIIDGDVIGGSVFGYGFNNSTRSKSSWKGKQELKVWQHMLSVKVPPKYKSLMDWHCIIETIVKQRIWKVSQEKQKIDLVTEMEMIEGIHPMLEGIIMDAALTAIDNFRQKNQLQDIDVEYLAQQKSERVGKLLGKMFDKHHSFLEYEPQLSELLDWRHWPRFINICENQSKLREGLSEKCRDACRLAKNTVLSLCTRFQTGDVSLNEVNLVGNNIDKIRHLYEACSGKDDVCSSAALESIINKRIVEELQFRTNHTYLSHLSRHITFGKGLESMKEELGKDYREVNINALCRRDPQNDQIVEITCFKHVGSLTIFVNDFKILSDSALFTAVWRDKMTIAARDHPELKLDDIYHMIWCPCLEHCKNIFTSLADLSMTLIDVDTEFKHHQQTLETQIQSLFTHITECTKVEPADWTEIERAIKIIKEYWKLCRYQEVASGLLGIRNALELANEDFSVVEKLSQKFGTSEESQTLKDIDDNLVKAGEFLQDIANDDRKLDCLKKFASCQDIVRWLQGNTKNVNEIQHFVNVALATAAGGEGDLSHDKLSHLKVVGSGFASLIYDFPTDAGFIDLMEASSHVWEALRKNENLPCLLEECNKDIEWYQSVKETQGSVEVTSYGQMRNILNYGSCEVGTMIQSNRGHRIHDIVSLVLTPKDKKLSKSSYNLDELQDLESKLVLITGSQAENRKEVDHYLNIMHLIIRIAEVLLALHHAGNVAYSGRVVTFECAVYTYYGPKQEPQFQSELSAKHIAQLQVNVKEMEDALLQWENEVKKSRSCFYELNYYTTLQLLQLRKELSLFRQIPYRQCDPEILSLLQSISHKISSKEVQCVMINLFKQNKNCLAAPDQVSAAVSEDENEHRVSDDDIEIVISHNTADSSAAINPPASFTSSNLKLSCDETKHELKEHLDLIERNLSSAQKEILMDLVHGKKYPRLLVLRAMEECPESDSPFYVQSWCIAHEQIQNIDESPMDSEESDYEQDESDKEQEESDEEQSANSIFNQSSQQSSQGSKRSTSESIKNKTFPVKVIHRQVTDETHPVVQELVEVYKYKLEDAIDAVRLTDGTLERSMDQLNSGNAEKEDATLELVVPVREQGEKIVVYGDCDADKRYLTLDELGTALGMLGQQLPGQVSKQRTFPDELKGGFPNLIATLPDDVLKTVLMLYMKDKDLPLPTLDEVLICNSTTSAEEVILLWQRSIHDPGFKRIFCLVHAENLSYQICDVVVDALKELIQQKQDYRLVIVSSKGREQNSYIVSKLLLYKRSFIMKYSIEQCEEYLRAHFIDDRVSSETGPGIQRASIVDHERSRVRVVFSKRAGMGKSLFIHRMAQHLGIIANSSAKAVHVVIPIHGPIVTSDILLSFLTEHYRDDECKIYQFDIAPNILFKVDTLLFSLLILGGLIDTQGRVWRFHPNQLYAIEVTLPICENIKDKAEVLGFLSLLPTVECLSPLESTKTTPNSSQLGMDEKEFHNPTFQRVYQYLRRYKSGINLDRFKYQGKFEGSTADCLKLYLQYCGVQDPSWAEIYHFTKFLDLQLESCEESVYCDESLVGDVMSGLKGFVVKFMITMSRDFSTPSLRGEVSRESLQIQLVQDGGNLDQYEIDHRRRWEESCHPYIFFNADRISITFVGFIINKMCNLLDPRGLKLESKIMTPHLYIGLIQQNVDFSDDYRRWTKKTMIEKLSLVMGVDDPCDPDDTYVLTIDNLVKILAIQMRFRCGIPVVIMGETGCGKTRLIRYMCDLARGVKKGRNMYIKKVHGGTTEEEIEKFIKEAENHAPENKVNKMDTVVFFDEANTTDAIGLIKEIMCDRRIHGRPISGDLKFIAACNPYRMHSNKMIRRLEAAGLGFYVQAIETQQKLGKIPLRQLVYRVLDLPPSMRPLVYDFGQLKEGNEDNYIRQIVSDHVKKSSALSMENAAVIKAIAKVLGASQAYMRNTKDECSFVSLRDIERAMIVFEYFYDKIDDFRLADSQLKECEDMHPNKITSALILAVGVCYHARLRKREKFEESICSKFMTPLTLSGGADEFRNEITWCQNVLLDNMELGPNIAKNAALRENVFMMAICVELRIPLFLVGKPGSSKSLAKSIIQNSMHGETSRSELLRKFKQVYMFSYQCSQLATPKSVIDVFKSAKRFQDTHEDASRYVSVVVLDEVGLAEDSPNLPLKALHPLLEDGTEGGSTEGRDEVIDRQERVAFIGISNWALDPAKMNRGVMVTRGKPDNKELRFSAKGICGNEKDDNAKAKLEPYFEKLAEAYEAICNKQEREFFGLRDFYSLIKMLYWMCKECPGIQLTWPQMKHAIMRNFGGLESKTLNPFEEFRKRLNLPDEELKREMYDEKTWRQIHPDCTRLGLIRTSLDTKETSFHGENRYLLFLTENYAALDILEHYIRGKSHEQRTKQPKSDNQPNNQNHEQPKEAATTKQALKPFTLFGSSFPKDKEYTQVCRNINQIKICMETGRTVILLNLENLYESLYDVLNQYYMHYGDNRYVDLGLQTHRVKCRVHKDFKLILIAERDTVYDKFPTPLINRLEKHFVLTSSVLEDWQQDVLYDFQEWIKHFSRVSENEDFKEGNAFMGYQKDTPAAVIFQASRQLTLQQVPYESDGLGEINIKELIKEKKGSDLWKKAVLQFSQYLLLQISSDDALVRLKRTALANHQKELMQLYFSQHHNSITDFLKYHLHNHKGSKEGLLMQVTTHGHLLLKEELDKIGHIADMRVKAFLLQEFDTEVNFSNKVGPLFRIQIEKDKDEQSCLLVIQCDSGHLNGDLIACARYRIYDERVKALERTEKKYGITHVLFIINLPHQVSSASSFVGFQGNPWISSHIDHLSPASVIDNPLQAISSTISELFIGRYTLTSQSPNHLRITASQSFEQLSDDKCRQNERRQSDYLSDMHVDKEVKVVDIKKEEQMDLLSAESLAIKPQCTEDVDPGQTYPTLDDVSVVPKSKMKQRVMVTQYPMAQCERLYGCIQAAASKLEDSTRDRSTQRVKRLTKLIPSDPGHHLESHSFYGILVLHLYRLLKEREADRPDLSEWVLSEALNASKLEVGGTFRNVLARKIDEVVIPIFAKIIACIDCNYNLDLIDPKAHDSPLSQLWLAIFREPNVLPLEYSELVQGDKVLGVGGKISSHDFRSEMPFSWLIKGAVDSQWDIAKSRAGTNRRSHHNQLCVCVQDTPIGSVLQSVDKGKCEDFYKFYLHDFVRSVYNSKYMKTKLTDMEYQLISDALNHLVKSTEFEHNSLISRITALHLVYMSNKPQVLCFSQLVSLFPSIIGTLKGILPVTYFNEMELHLYAVMKVMDKLEPPLAVDNPKCHQNLINWLNSIRQAQNTIVSILTLKSSSKVAVQVRCRWQSLHAVRLFVEHVVLKHPTTDLVLPAIRLFGLLKSADFLKCVSVKSVQLLLVGMKTALRNNGVDEGTIKEIKKSCREYFIYLVSDLCFGGRTAPEPDLIKMLLDTVFVDKNESTQELTPYKNDRADKIPTIRSFILQMLLEHNPDEVRNHLKEYLDRARNVISRKDNVIDQNLYLLIVQCIEDSLAKNFSSQSLLDKARATKCMILEGNSALQKQQQGTPTLEYLEGVAKVRCSLLVVAEVLNNGNSGLNFKELLTAAGQICSDRKVNCINAANLKDSVGPVIYLLKLMMRQYGKPYLKEAVKSHTWLLPAELELAIEDDTMDPFVVYGDNYKKIRETVVGVMYGNQLEALHQHTQPQEIVYFLLALYEKATLSRTSTNPLKLISSDALEKLNEFIMNYQILSTELRLTARSLLANEQGGRVLQQMFVSPEQPLLCRSILDVVIHTAAICFGRENVDVLLPFVNILRNPAALNHSYLPTMPEDQLIDSRVLMTATVEDENGKFYECPRGHPYFVGNCGNVVESAYCYVCHAPIGGIGYAKLHKGNKLANLQDTTKMGHDLGAPQDRTLTSPERDLSARAVSIIRVLMHSAFIWAICNNKAVTEAIARLVSPPVPPQQLPEFFWAHLVKDLELFGKDTGKGLEENVMIVHLVLRQILTTKPPIGGANQNVNTLTTKEARHTWENIFTQHYIKPVLTNLDHNLEISMDMVARDNQQDHDQLFYLVYEKVKCHEETLEPHLWTYRSRITLEHLRQSLHDKKKRHNYPILATFLQCESELRATQYLPDIAKLQQCLFDKFNHQIDKHDSKKQTVGMFINELPKSVKNEYREMIDSFQAAWALVGYKLKKHNRLPVEEKYYVGQIDDNTPMEYLIPTTSEAGVCTTALVDFLTLTHNNFIERCRAVIAENNQSIKSQLFSRENRIPISHIHRCHLVDYEHQLPSIILSHCHYSLKVGKGQDVTYDHQALEKHILNRFIHGKPLIILEIPHVVYRKDIYTTDIFADVRRKVAPQEILQPRVKQEIIAELYTPDRLREALDVVEIVLGFLSSGGGKADKPLGEYIDKTLKMRKRHFSQKAKSSCQLRHALSLWETIAVQLARQLCLRGQEPFDSIRQEFLRELSKGDDKLAKGDDKLAKGDDVDQLTALDCCLGKFDPDLLQGALYEFIETYVKHCPLHESDQRLVDVLELVLDQYGTELPHLSEFPASIKLDQAVAAWKHIVHYYAKKN